MEQCEAILTERYVWVCTYVASVFVCSSVSSSCWGRPWMETPPWLCPDWTLWMNSVSWSEWGRDGPARPERQTWRYSPPPHTAGTHTIHSQLTWCRAISGWLKLHVVQVVSRYSDSWLTGLLCVRVCSPWMACPRCGSACASAASSDWWMVCCTPCSLSTDTQTPVWDTYKHTLWLQSQYTQTHTNCSGGDEITALAWI